MSGGGEKAATQRRRRWLVDVFGLALVLALFAGGIVALRAYAGADSARDAAPAAPQVRPTAAPGPWPEAKRALDDQAAALLRGDEKGWLAAVDPLQPKLLAEYRRTFANLRQLGVTGFAYNVRFPAVLQPGSPELTTYPVVAFCLQQAVCPAFDLGRMPASQPVSSFQEKLSMTRRGGRYVITAAAILPGEPVVPPWLGELRFAQGRRVTVAAAPSQAKRLRAVVAAADKAAVTADRYARLVHNPQEHYRMYLAGEAEWGGEPAPQPPPPPEPVAAATPAPADEDEYQDVGPGAWAEPEQFALYANALPCESTT